MKGDDPIELFFTWINIPVEEWEDRDSGDNQSDASGDSLDRDPHPETYECHPYDSYDPAVFDVSPDPEESEIIFLQNCGLIPWAVEEHGKSPGGNPPAAPISGEMVVDVATHFEESEISSPVREDEASDTFVVDSSRVSQELDLRPNGGFRPDRQYSFSRELATEIGVDEAILLKWISYMVPRSNRLIGDRRYVRTSTLELETRYPWRSRKTWGSILRKLCAKGILIASDEFRIGGSDRTRAFAISEEMSQRSQSKPVYFRAGDAARYGVCAAVLLSNLLYFLGQNLKERGSPSAHPMSPTRLAQFLPCFSHSSIKRALKELTEAGAITAKWDEKKQITHYWTDEIGHHSPTPGSSGVRKQREQNVDSPDEPELVVASRSAPFEKLIRCNQCALSNLSREEITRLCNEATASITQFLDELSPNQLNALRHTDDTQRLIVLGKIGPWMDLPQRISSIAQEIAAIALRSTPNPSSHELVAYAGYKTGLSLNCKISEWRRNRAREKHQTSIDDFYRRFATMLNDSAAAAEQKANGLLKAVAERISIGTLRNPYTLTDLQINRYRFSIHPADQANAVAFFRENPMWTGGHLVQVIEACAQLETEPDAEGYDKQWHARRATNFSFLFEHLTKVISGLSFPEPLPELKG